MNSLAVEVEAWNDLLEIMGYAVDSLSADKLRFSGEGQPWGGTPFDTWMRLIDCDHHMRQFSFSDKLAEEAMKNAGKSVAELCEPEILKREGTTFICGLPRGVNSWHQIRGMRVSQIWVDDVAPLPSQNSWWSDTTA